MRVVAIIQARMGSTRLPGKVMLPLAGDHVLTHDVTRTEAAGTVDDVAVATSIEKQDDIVEQYAKRVGVRIYRGSESDVLDRMFSAAKQMSADVVVRVTGDCPLIDPEIIDTVVTRLIESDAVYAANILERTFPRGLDVEAFTFDSFKHVHAETTEPHHREHVTPAYRDWNNFETVSVTSADVFEDSQFQNRNDLRLTLDEADDYEILRDIYENIPFDEILPVRDAIQYADKRDLAALNDAVKQKEV